MKTGIAEQVVDNFSQSGAIVDQDKLLVFQIGKIHFLTAAADGHADSHGAGFAGYIVIVKRRAESAYECRGDSVGGYGKTIDWYYK